MDTVAELRGGVCQICGDAFQYEYKGMARRYCEECRILRAKETSYKQRQKLKLKPGQLNGRNINGLQPLARCSQEEAAVRLSVIETLELQARTGDPNAFVEPLSQQRIQQIEREAFRKIADAMRKDWTDYKEMLADKDNSPSDTASIMVSSSGA